MRKIPVVEMCVALLVVYIILIVLGYISADKCFNIEEAFQGRRKNKKKGDTNEDDDDGDDGDGNDILVCKNALKIYDKFYAKVYERVFTSDFKNMYEMEFLNNKLFKKWQPTEDVHILDAGSGTGRHCFIIDKKYHYKVTGLDISRDMINQSKINLPKGNFVHGDMLNKSIFKSNTFSHITCFFFTIYYFKDTGKVFDNFNKWLKPQGYICVHLVNKEKFDPVLEQFSGLIPLYDPQKDTKKRVKESELTFKKFKYKTDWDFGNPAESVFKEHFTFKDGRKRVNKHKLYIKTIKQMVSSAQNNGFKKVFRINLGPANHDYEYIYVFQKID